MNCKCTAFRGFEYVRINPQIWIYTVLHVHSFYIPGYITVTSVPDEKLQHPTLVGLNTEPYI
jgi:hypothetical protein